MTTLRVGVVNGLTDDEIIAIRKRVKPDGYDRPWADTLAFAREVERMALRIPRQASEIVGRMAEQQLERVRELEAERDALRAALPDGWRVRTNCDNVQRWLVITGPLGQSAAFEVDHGSVRAEVLRDFARAIDAAIAGSEPTP